MENLNKDKTLLFNATCSVGLSLPYRTMPHFQNAGCGTFISENEIVTCWHVLLLDNGKEIPSPLLLVKNQNGAYSRIEKRVIDRDLDLAYLKLKDPIGRNIIPCVEERHNFDLKDKFHLLSCYKGKPNLDKSLLKTVFSKHVRIKSARNGGRFDVYITKENIRKGYSGSSILLNGKVCSVLSAKSLEYAGEVWAPSTYEFARFIKKARAPSPPKKHGFLQRSLKRMKLI